MVLLVGVYLFISQIITPDMNKRREKLSFWKSHCSSPMTPSTGALGRKEPLYRNDVWGNTLVGRGRDPRREEWQIASYMDGKGHCNKSNLGNWEQVQCCCRLEENTKSKQTEQSKRQNFLHVWMSDWAVESFWELTKWKKIPSMPWCETIWKWSIYSGQ